MDSILKVALVILLIPIAAYVLFWIALIGMASLTKTLETLNPSIDSLERTSTKWERSFISFCRKIGLNKVMPWKFSAIIDDPKPIDSIKK